MVSNVTINRPIMLSFVHPDNDRFSFSCVENEAEAVRGKLDALQKAPRRQSGQGATRGAISHFNAHASLMRATEAMLAGFHPQSADEAYGQILNTQLPVANSLLTLAFYITHPQADAQRGFSGQLDTSAEGRIAQDPFMSESYDYGQAQLTQAKEAAKKIRGGATSVVDRTFKAGGMTNPLSNESKFSRALSNLDQSIDSRIEQIDGFIHSGAAVTDDAKPYYEAAKLILGDAKAHLGDWRQQVLGTPQPDPVRQR